MQRRACVAAVLVALVACAKDKPADSHEGHAAAEGATETGKSAGDGVEGKAKAGDDKPVKAAAGGDTYKVRGVFKGMEGELVAIQHEAIPQFRNREGETSEMMAMQMSFRVDSGVDMQSIAVGDKIQFEFVVEWEQSPPIKVTSVDKLPAEEELKL